MLLLYVRHLHLKQTLVHLMLLLIKQPLPPRLNWPTVASADRYLVLANETGTVAFTPENGSNYESEDNLDFIQALIKEAEIK